MIEGIDFGGYTVWRRDAIRGKMVHFTICGATWGDHVTPTWNENREQIKDEYRRLLYCFWHRSANPIKQADLILNCLAYVNAQAVGVDVERSTYGLIEDEGTQRAPRVSYRQAKSIRIECDYLLNNFSGKVMLYGNHNDLSQIQRHFDFSDLDLWIASPGRPQDSIPLADKYWKDLGRKKGDYTFDQWSWKGYAPDYGAVNDKKEMDLTQFNGTLAELDQWLGLEPAKPRRFPRIPKYYRR